MGWTDDQSRRRVAHNHCVIYSERFISGPDNRLVQPALLSGWSRRHLHEEPAERELRFSISGEEVGLEVYFFSDHRRDFGNGERKLAITGSYEEICVPFWRALRDLQGRFSYEELETRWNRPWPWKEIGLLTAAVKEKMAH
jgi:hypothetical protein